MATIIKQEYKLLVKFKRGLMLRNEASGLLVNFGHVQGLIVLNIYSGFSVVWKTWDCQGIKSEVRVNLEKFGDCFPDA